MRTALFMIGALFATGCAASAPQDDVLPATPEYRGVEVVPLDDELVNLFVQVAGTRDATAVTRYAECAAAQYTLDRGYGFAWHLRTTVQERGGIWTADAVYTISPALPRGLRTIDAEVTVADCGTSGIPTV